VGDFDITSKFLIEAGPRDWLVLAGLPVPADPAAVRLVDADLATVSNAPDKLILVDGSDGPRLVHIETQSGADGRFDDRVLLYNVLARWRHEMPVQSVAFLLRPAAVTPRLTGTVQVRPGGRGRLDFGYDLVRVWELPVEQILAGGPATLPLAPVAAVRPEDVPAVIEQMRDRLSREVPTARARDLWQATEIFMGLRYDEAVATAFLRGVLDMQESTVYQRIVATGVARGEARGRVEGERKLIVRRASRRFGTLSPAALARLESIDDVAELERLDDALDTAASCDEWLRS
jgi:hypothetical protein